MFKSIQSCGNALNTLAGNVSGFFTLDKTSDLKKLTPCDLRSQLLQIARLCEHE